MSTVSPSGHVVLHDITEQEASRRLFEENAAAGSLSASCSMPAG
ncbi:MAG: hypothetical protein R3D03_14280 [Geminicoccaceae bacterium]